VPENEEISLVPLGGLRVEEGPDQGLVIAVGERPVTVGRESACEVRLTDTSASRRHFRIGPDVDNRLTLEDLGSANGTFVNEAQMDRCLLTPGDRIRLGDTVLVFLSEEELVEALRQRTMRVVERDRLTGVSSRRMFEMRLRTEVALAARSGGVFSVGVVRVDRLDEIAALSPDAVDRVLRAVALALGGYLRENDLLARLEEQLFAVLIVDPSPNVAYLAAERMCAGVEALTVDVGPRAVGITASIGMASEKGRRELLPEKVIDRAAAEAARAAEVGGNCVSRWVHPSVREPVPSVSGDLRGTVIAPGRTTPANPPGNRGPGDPGSWL
jgi:diguanylate cyclase (GGDEF)-like protein